MTQLPKYPNLTTSMHLCHAARSRTMLSRPFFGYSVQTSELAPVGKWHFQYPPSLNVPSRNDLSRNHRPVCRCHPHQHRNPWAGWSYRSPEHGEADSIDNIAHTPTSVDSARGRDCSPILFSCPIIAAWMGDLLHNCRNIRSCHLSQRELSNAAQGECGERYWQHINPHGSVGGNWSDRLHGTTEPYNDLASVQKLAVGYSCRVIEQNVAGFVHFDDVVKFRIHDDVDGFRQLSRKMQFQSEVSLFHQVEMSTLVQIWRQIESKQCEPVSVFVTTDLVSTIMPHKSRAGEERCITPRAQLVIKLGSEWFGRNLFSVHM